MFARRVSMQLKPNSLAEMTQRLEKEIIPLLRKQKGFQDQITFFVPGGTYVFGISLWDTKDDAEAYAHGPYAEVSTIMAKLVEGTPKVSTFEVATSTFHKIAAAVTA